MLISICMMFHLCLADSIEMKINLKLEKALCIRMCVVRCACGRMRVCVSVLFHVIVEICVYVCVCICSCACLSLSINVWCVTFRVPLSYQFKQFNQFKMTNIIAYTHTHTVVHWLICGVHLCSLLLFWVPYKEDFFCSLYPISLTE